MPRRSLGVSAARMFQRLPISWARPLEAGLVRSRAAGSPNLVFLLALPRSGSTLTYQALVHGLQPLYLSNLWNLLYGVPWLGGAISRHRCKGHLSDFRSNHGFVDGLCGPAEGLRFWSYWTGCGLDETASGLVSEAKMARRVNYFRNVVRSLATPDEPMVGGYLGHALITERLRYWFPEAIFIRLHRDPLCNALSILRSRQSGGGGWFSVFSADCQSVKGCGLHKEVAAQVFWLNRRLEWLSEDNRTIHLAYEELGQDPNGALERVIGDLNTMGLDVSLRKALPQSFSYRMASPDDDVDSLRLWEEMQRLEADYGCIRVKRREW